MSRVIKVLGKARGPVRKDRVKVLLVKGGEKELKGYVKTVSRNGLQVVSTHYKEKVVEGYDPVWLAARNSIKLPAVAQAA